MAGRQLAGQHRHHGIMPKLVMVVHVLISQRDANNPLHHQGFDRMLDVARVTAVPETRGQAAGQAENPIRRAQQQRSRVAGDLPAVKRGAHRPSFDACKSKQVRATLCWHRALLCLTV